MIGHPRGLTYLDYPTVIDRDDEPVENSTKFKIATGLILAAWVGAILYNFSLLGAAFSEKDRAKRKDELLESALFFGIFLAPCLLFVTWHCGRIYISRIAPQPTPEV